MFMILSLKGIIVLFFLIQQMQFLSTSNNLFSLINFNEALEIMNHSHFRHWLMWFENHLLSGWMLIQTLLLVDHSLSILPLDIFSLLEI